MLGPPIALRQAWRSGPFTRTRPCKFSSLPSRSYTTATKTGPTNDVDHAEFLHEGRDSAHYKPSASTVNGRTTKDELKDVEKRHDVAESQWVGKLSPTSSHLFKLLLPLPKSIRKAVQHQRTAPCTSSNPSNSLRTAYLLHPSQPLSHLSRLILGSLPPDERSAEVEFRALSLEDHSAYPTPSPRTELSTTESTEHQEKHSKSSLSQSHDEASEQGEADEEAVGGPLLHERVEGGGDVQEVRWSPSTDLGDFIKQATVSQSFRIVIIPPEQRSATDRAPRRTEPEATNEGDDGTKSVDGPDRRQHGEDDVSAANPGTADKQREQSDTGELSIKIMIPSFASRTVYLRKRLLSITKEIQQMTQQKKKLDHEAHKGARRIAMSGLAGLVAYWGVVCKLTFFSSYGWDVMEPVTYLSGLTTVIGGYLFFLYHNREVSYSSILDLSVSARQQELYKTKGLDIERWTELVAEAKTLRREISRIAADYDYDWKGQLNNLGDADVPLRQRQAPGAVPPVKRSAGNSNTNNSVDDQHTREQGIEPRAQTEELDVAKTIDEAVELEEQTKAKQRQRHHGEGSKGEVMDAKEEEGRRKGEKAIGEHT